MPRLLSLVMFLPLASAPLAGAPSTKPTVPEVRIDGLDGDAVLNRDVLAVCRDIARFCATTMPSGPPLQM